MKPAILIYFAILIFGCANPSNRVPLIAKDSTNEIERNNKLFVFVGEKIDVKHEPNKDSYSLDNKFTARYKVLQSVYGKYDNDYIEFKVYDHYGWPAFSKYKHVLLFVSEDSGKYYHEKYMYNDVYKTKSGRWAGSYAIDDYEHPYNKSTAIKPEIIDFKEELSYPTQTVYQDGSIEEHYYPEPYFKIVDDKAIAIYGNYIEDLFRLKKEGVLSARELFGNKPPDGPIVVKDVWLERVVPDGEKKKFMAFWENTFVPIIKSGNVQLFKNWSLVKISICDSVQQIDAFDQECFRKIFTKAYFSALESNNGMSFSSYETNKDPISNTTLTGHRIVKKKDHIIYTMDVNKKQNSSSISFVLEFIEIDKGFALTSIYNDWNKKCCL